eukprot:3535482-Pleurochrysis_carterae.AAC.1
MCPHDLALMVLLINWASTLHARRARMHHEHAAHAHRMCRACGRALRSRVALTYDTYPLRPSCFPFPCSSSESLSTASLGLTLPLAQSLLSLHTTLALTLVLPRTLTLSHLLPPFPEP